MENVKLIIVEDEPAILRGIELLIGQIDLPIEIVGTYLKGQDALDEFEKVSPDIVLTDVQMPVITGLELIQEMKTRGYSAEYLILSSYAEFQYVQQAIKLDVRNYLLKPPMISELRDSLEAACTRICQKRYTEFEKILKNIIFQEYRIEEAIANPRNKKYKVYLYLLGPYLEWGTEGMVFYPSKWTCESVLEQISEKTTKDCSRIWVLNGRYPNLKIIISQEDSSYGNEIYQALKQQAEEIGFSATVIVGHNCKELHCLREEVIKCQKCLKRNVQFGTSQKYLMAEDEKALESANISREDRELIYQALSLNRKEQVIHLYQILSDKWKRENYSQAIYVENTRYIFSMIANNILDMQKADIEEDALKQISIISAVSKNAEDFTEQVSNLIEEIYDGMKKQDGDNQIEKVVELLWDHIHQHFMEEIDVNEFAKKYGYHPVYMITQFSKLKGISPTKLIIQKKMTLARQLLNDTDMTLKNIASAIGYNDVSYFSRTFKEHEGVSPSAYRKKINY